MEWSDQRLPEEEHCLPIIIPPPPKASSYDNSVSNKLLAVS